MIISLQKVQCIYERQSYIAFTLFVLCLLPFLGKNNDVKAERKKTLIKNN